MMPVKQGENRWIPVSALTEKAKPMTKKTKTKETHEPWDSRELGAEEKFATVHASDEAAIDAALELQPISIRLQKSLIEDFKLIAQLSGLGYQPLMRQVLARFADCEKKRILREAVSSAAQRKIDNVDSNNNELRTGTKG